MARSRTIDLWRVMATIAAFLFIAVLILQPAMNRENILTPFDRPALVLDLAAALGWFVPWSRRGHGAVA